MATTYETEEQKEKVVLLAVDLDNGENVDFSLDELEELAATAGAETVGRLIQKKESIHPGTYIGKGKIEELAKLVEMTGADTVICDDELSPAQLGNLQDMLNAKVIDRTVLILDIFASHASTSEGKLQIELAQLKYRSSRLIGLRSSLSRTGGSSAGMGIGSKGPGEKKLELDRRLIKDRMTYLYKELKDVKRAREVLRSGRKRDNTPVIAIVGYTNAGKSTLLNSLTDAKVLEEDKLFATLDPTTRSFSWEKGQKALFTDTVGFIHKLPHHLIESFRSTLEEAKYADLILHVVDASNEEHEKHMEVVYDTLHHLGADDKPIITAFNKIDRFENGDTPILKDEKARKVVRISAKKKIGFEDLLHTLFDALHDGFKRLEQVIPYSQAAVVQQIRSQGTLEKEEYVEDGIYIEAMVPVELYGSIIKHLQ